MITWVASFPRSGNTFLRIMLNTLFGIESYSIYDDKSDIGADERTSEIVGHRMLPENFDIDVARVSEEVFYIKTHELPDERIDVSDRVIYLVRDGRESAVSLMKHQQRFGDAETSLVDVINGDAFGGSWGEHVLAWSNVQCAAELLIKFEDLTTDGAGTATRLSDFLGIDTAAEGLPTFEELHELNPEFFASGRKDSWKSIFSDSDNLLFWLSHHAALKANGYLDDMPAVFADESFDRALTELKSRYRLLADDVTGVADEFSYSNVEKKESKVSQASLQGVLQNKVDRINELSDRVEHLESELSRERRSNAVHLEEFASYKKNMQEQREKLQANIDGSKEQYRHLQEEHRSLVESSKEAIESLEQRLEEANRERSGIRKSLLLADEEIVALREEIVASGEALTRSEEALSTTEEALSTTEEALSRSGREFRDLDAESSRTITGLRAELSSIYSSRRWLMMKRLLSLIGR